MNGDRDTNEIATSQLHTIILRVRKLKGIHKTSGFF